MNMKEHIFAALREQFNHWEELLAGLSEEQITTPHFDFNWSIKDVMAHLWAWQQISIARMQGGLQDREPEFPKWIVESIENWEEDADRVNAVIFETQYAKPWSEIYENWRDGFFAIPGIRKTDFGKKPAGRWLEQSKKPQLELAPS